MLLQRNYVPRYLLGEDGKFFDQQCVDGSRGHERISAGLAILHVTDAERVLATVARCRPEHSSSDREGACLTMDEDFLADPFEGKGKLVSDPCRFDVRAWVHTDDNGVTHVCHVYRVDPVIEANRDRYNASYGQRWGDGASSRRSRTASTITAISPRPSTIGMKAGSSAF